ncbi:amidohydrolase family protein [Rhizorhabdus wittichii]|uniref:Amidohydrolase family protein n=1 Tax=Rhizorhabdus wittichii TaxID=160791 RepID=A0A975D272_9SPHN|nr:amidohydrolase family protein [Rhizorhabdus wittichii]QTH21441.1 amidohydrolase family protein [Rhizorhabdus wittichii]
MRFRHDPEGLRLPVKLDSTTNGEFEPAPLARRDRQAIALAQQNATENARRTGMSRRQFMISSCGAANVLMALNAAGAAAGEIGGVFALAPDAAVDPAAAAATLASDDFIFDVQNHAVNPTGPWRRRASGLRLARSMRGATDAGKAWTAADDELGYLNLLDGEHYVKDVFLDSDTQMAVMSVLSVDHDDEPLPIQDAAAVRALVDRLGSGRRLLLHGKILPNHAGDLDRMEAFKTQWGVSAWKLYTQLPGEGSRGYRLDDEALMTPFVEKSRRLGIDIVCAHKGFRFGSGDPAFATCHDVGRAARLYPDMKFLIYHGGYDKDGIEGPYDPDRAEIGINTLVKSLQDNGIAPNSNVYAELGATWRQLMTRPDQAAHAWGKLLKHVGEDNVLWGTDCIWYGSPQDQIQAFRAFQFSESFRERHGYPELTPALKAKIFGLNAARVYKVDVPGTRRRLDRDALSLAREGYLAEADPSFLTYGPKSMAEFRALQRSGH